MSNHAASGETPGSEGQEELKQRVDCKMDEIAQKLGATGQFPRGKLTDEDEGEIALAVTVDKNTLIIDFGKSVKWFGMSKEQAHQLADLIRRRADEIKVEAMAANPRSETSEWCEVCVCYREFSVERCPCCKAGDVKVCQECLYKFPIPSKEVTHGS